MSTRAVLHQCLLMGLQGVCIDTLLAEAFELLLPRSNQPCPMLRSRHHSSHRLERYSEGMVPHSLQARSTPASPDILRTPPVNHPPKPSFMFAQGQHPNQLLPPRRVQKLATQVSRVQQRVDPVDFHMSVRPCLLKPKAPDLKMMIELPNAFAIRNASCR